MYHHYMLSFIALVILIMITHVLVLLIIDGDVP